MNDPVHSPKRPPLEKSVQLSLHRRSMLRKYGSKLTWDELFQKQNGKCAICKIEPDKIVIDHCHRTNTVRGLLCQACNAGLGMFKDSADRCRDAIAYLESNDYRVGVRRRRWRGKDGEPREGWMVQRQYPDGTRQFESFSTECEAIARKDELLNLTSIRKAVSGRGRRRSRI